MSEHWDELLALVGRIARGDEPGGAEHLLAELCRRCQAEGYVDRELDAEATARALRAVALGHRAIAGEVSADRDHDEATMLVVLTRWLHPPRMGPL